MRELGFSEKWPKLKQDFTTFRFQRRDKDWQVGEVVKVVYRPRTKQREVLGVAKIISKAQRAMAWHGDRTGAIKVTDEEAIADGFIGRPEKSAYFEMWEFLFNYYGGTRLLSEPMNKLTLQWVKPKSIIYLLDGEPQIGEVGGPPWGYEGDIARDVGGQKRLEVIKVLEWEKDDRRSR